MEGGITRQGMRDTKMGEKGRRKNCQSAGRPPTVTKSALSAVLRHHSAQHLSCLGRCSAAEMVVLCDNGAHLYLENAIKISIFLFGHLQLKMHISNHHPINNVTSCLRTPFPALGRHHECYSMKGN